MLVSNGNIAIQDKIEFLDKLIKKIDPESKRASELRTVLEAIVDDVKLANAFLEGLSSISTESEPIHTYGAGGESIAFASVPRYKFEGEFRGSFTDNFVFKYETTKDRPMGGFGIARKSK